MVAFGRAWSDLDDLWMCIAVVVMRELHVCVTGQGYAYEISAVFRNVKMLIRCLWKKSADTRAQ